MEIIAVYNVKGGVGKSTTAVNLAYLSAAAGWRTLLWDLDAQGASTFMLQSASRRKAGARRIVRGERSLERLIRPTAYPNLDLLPSHLSYRNMDLHLNDRKHRARQLLKVMRHLQVSYGSVFLDCPPGLSLVSENIIHAADALLIPTLPAPLSIRMLDQVQQFVADHKRDENLLLLPFFSMVDRRRSLHEDSIAAIRQRFPAMLATEVPYLSEIEHVSVRRAPLPAYAPRNPGAIAYRDLWAEIERRLNEAGGAARAAASAG